MENNFKGIDEFDNLLWVEGWQHCQFFLTKELAKQIVFTFAMEEVAIIKKSPDAECWYITKK